MIHRNYSIMLPKRNVASAFWAQKVKPQIIGNNNNFAVSFHVLCCACFSQKAGAFLRLFPRKSTTQFLNKDKIFFLRISGAAAEGMTGLTLRAPWGHTAIQRIQEMHAFSSTFLGFSLSMACTGHAAAQAPQLVHSFVALGTILTPPAFL